jgi:DNA-directed RNA polymerase-3 subunit RPC5
MDVDDIDPKLQQSASTNTIDDDDEDDPVTATYNVFINPSLPLGRRLLILQHPNTASDTPQAAPTELRLKTRAGMVEVDLPLDHSVAYDREKGLKWGKGLQASMAAKNGGSHGLAGGFGVGGVQGRGGRKKAEEDADNLDWAEAVRQDKVLRTQTLGGHYPKTQKQLHMVGVFQGSEYPHFLLRNAFSNMYFRGAPSHPRLIPRYASSSATPHRRSRSTRSSSHLKGCGTVFGCCHCPGYPHDSQDHRRR